MLIKFIGCLLVLSAFTNADQYNNDDNSVDDYSPEDPTPDMSEELPAPVPAPRDVPKPSSQYGQRAPIPKDTPSSGSYGQKPKDPPTPNAYSLKLPADPPAPNSYAQKLPKDTSSYGQKVPKDTPSNSYGSKVPVPDTPTQNSYGQKVPKDTPTNSYGSKIPVPKDTPSNSYGGQKIPKDTPSNSYDSKVPKDTPSNSYDQKIPKDTPSNSYGQKVLERPAPLPKKDSPSPYAQRIHPKDMPMSNPYGQKLPKDVPSPNPYGGKKPTVRPIQPINPIVPSDEGTDIIPSPSTCPIGNTWTDVVECYECEIHKSALACKSELPPSFDLCSNKTAIFRMAHLFTDCLNAPDKLPTCHKMNENMALAFLMANYDSEIVDLNRRSECLFRTARDPVMQCMSQCQDLSDPSAIDSEPIVVCYNELHDQISGMLHDFADCVQKN